MTVKKGNNKSIQIRSFGKRVFSVKHIAFLISVLILIVAVVSISMPGHQKMKIEKGVSQNYDSIFAIGTGLFYTDTDKARNLIMNEYQHLNGKNVRQQMRFLNFIGATYQVQDNYTMAVEYYYKALKLSPETVDSTLMVAIYNNIGYINQKTGNFKTALNFMLKALNSNKKNNIAASILNNIGIVYLSIEEFDKGETYFRKALTYSMSENDSISMTTILTNLGFIFMNKEQPDSAQYYFTKSLQVANNIDNIYSRILVYNGLGDLFTQTGNFKDAETNHEKARHLAENINDSYSTAYAVMGLAKIEILRNNLNEALLLIQQGTQIAERINNDLLIYECKKLFSEIYQQAGEYEKSLSYLQEYINLKEKFVNQNTIRQVYNEEITVLNESNKIKQLEIEQQELQLSRKNILVISVLIVFLLGIFGFYFMFMNYRYRQNAKLQNLIIEMNERKSRTSIEAEIRERKRIGQDLHDGLGQMLSVARLNVSALNQKTELTNERKIKLIESAIYSIDTAFSELRQISHNLSPTILVAKGLEEAVQDIVRRINESNKILISCEIFGLNRQLDNLIENTLYRAVQELTNNAIKHAHATSISIQLVQNEEEITLMIEDNGVGFDLNKERGHSISGGIQNIQSRVENLHGTIYIDSKENRGTIITITAPLNNLDYATIKN